MLDELKMKYSFAFKSGLSGIASLCTLVACLLPLNRPAAAETTKPAANPELAPELRVADRFSLAIPTNGFGKQYLFTASLIPQAGAATSTGLAGRIVRFELFPDGVDMYESTQGLVVTEDLPARRLLATFPILRQEPGQVVVDFNKGMRQVFTQAWTQGGGLSAEHDRSLEVPEGRVFEMRQEQGQLIIRQAAQARSREAAQNLGQRFELRYFISPYHAGACSAKEPDLADSRYTRFFQTEGRLEPVTGRVSSRIARFDIRQPVVFYYSANTPADYVQAVKDGILYWNRAFGKEVVQAKKAPEGVTAPDAKLNIIQWVPWDNAGFAYADVLLDPLTGESGHGQAYITSVFGFGGKSRARALLRAMQDLAEKKDDKSAGATLGAALPFLGGAPCCQVDGHAFAVQMTQGLQELLASDELTDAAVLQVSQDYVRETVAHEVGHVLGLRHNFAGSLAATLGRKELDDWFKDYVLGKTSCTTYTNRLASSSMMEYTVFKGAVFTGWLIRTTQEVLPHDRAAIAWGYFDKPDVREQKMLFATDEDASRYGDVRTFDYGTNPVVNAYCELAQTLDLLPNNIIETFISARAPRNAHDQVPLADVNLSCTGYANQLANQVADMLNWFRAETRSVRVENDFEFLGDLNRKERLAAHLKFLNQQLDQLGGVDRALFAFLPLDLKLELKAPPAGLPAVTRLSATNLQARLEKLLDAPTYRTFVGLDDKKYSFTKEERDLILKRSKRFFEELEKEVVKQVCVRLTSTSRNLGVEANGAAGEEDVTAKVERRIIELSKLVILARDEASPIDGKVDKGCVQVTAFKYDQETRLAAARALDDKTGSFKGWAEDAKSDLNTQLKNDVEAALNLAHFKDFKVSLLSRSVREWYQRQLEVLALLPPAPGNPTLPAR